MHAVSLDKLQLSASVKTRISCQLCYKHFSNIGNLNVHMRMHGSSNIGRPHLCTLCGKAFMRKRELDRHTATHTGMKPFECLSCDKRFGRKDKLVRHMRIHDVVREHICDICGASFNRRDGLTHHMRTHTKDETECFGISVDGEIDGDI